MLYVILNLSTFLKSKPLYYKFALKKLKKLIERKNNVKKILHFDQRRRDSEADFAYNRPRSPTFITSILHGEYFKIVITKHSYTLLIELLNKQFNCFYWTRHSVNFRMSRPTLILFPLKAFMENLKYVVTAVYCARASRERA